MSSRNMTDTSFAVENAPGAGSPVQLEKWVSVMPSSAALPFMSSTNAGTLPEIFSARATQASFAEQTMTAFMSCSAVCWVPASRKTCDPPMPAAFSETGTRSEGASSPLSIASKTRSAVMILTMLAMGRFAVSFLAYMTTLPSASVR